MDYRKKFFVDPADRLRLAKVDPSYKGEHESAETAKHEIEHYRAKLAAQQVMLFAQHRHSVLVVLQAMDAGGKDGTISHVYTAFNPQGTTVTCFKQPTPVELAHDFLWRVHAHTPGRGEVAIFNRSHYEDVLVARVHKLIDAATCSARYRQIREFELGLVDQGTTILKFFLHISKEEQLSRFGERLADPDRNWKISETDYIERGSWDEYMVTVEDALNATSTEKAPWYTIPSNHKWFRNLAVSQIMSDTLGALGLAFPPPSIDLAEIRRRYHAAERAERRSG